MRALLHSILVDEETDDHITARAALGGRWQAIRHTIVHPIIYSVFPRRLHEVSFGADAAGAPSVDDMSTRRVWRWRGREFCRGEWQSWN